MSDKLQEICEKRLLKVKEHESHLSLSDLKDEVSAIDYGNFAFSEAIRHKASMDVPALIAEIKRRSPSAGEIREPFDAGEIAVTYKNNGAACLSVLTEPDYFGGCDADLLLAKRQSGMPVLRKDFVVSEYQIYESALLRADCILLIVAALSDEQLKHYASLAHSLHLDVLVEVHDLEELKRALGETEADLLGVNNRNLKTLKTDINTSYDLLQHIPDTVLKVSESGIKDSETLYDLYNAGYDAFLVGESLLVQKDLATATEKLLTKNGTS